jgi:hypothetical protein
MTSSQEPAKNAIGVSANGFVGVLTRTGTRTSRGGLARVRMRSRRRRFPRTRRLPRRVEARCVAPLGTKGTTARRLIGGPGERPQSREESSQPRFLLGVFHMRHEPREERHVARTVPRHLIGDVRITRLRVAGLRDDGSGEPRGVVAHELRERTRGLEWAGRLSKGTTRILPRHDALDWPRPAPRTSGSG